MLRTTCARIFALGLTVLTVVGAGGCGGSEPAPATGADEKQSTQVKILMNWFAQPEQAGYWQAEAQGLGAKHGIALENVQGGPQIQTIPQVASGKAQFGVTQADTLMQARAEGVPVVFIFAPFEHTLQCLMYHPSSGIRDFPDVDGHTVAIAPSGGFWPWVKARFDLDDVKEVNYTGVIANFVQDDDLVQQCLLTAEPYYASKQGVAHAELKTADVGYDPYYQGLFTTERVIRENPDLVRQVVATAKEGWEAFAQDPAPARELITKVNKDSDPQLVDFAHRKMLDEGLLVTPLKAMDASRWSDLYRQLDETGQFKRSFDVAGAYTNDYFPGKDGT